MQIPLDKLEDMLEQSGFTKGPTDEGNDMWYQWWQHYNAGCNAVCIVTSKDSPTWYSIMVEEQSTKEGQIWDRINNM